MLALSENWVWDCWLFDDGQEFHIFFLQAPKSLEDSDKRHLNASVGHAKSKDLINWERLPDALKPSDEPAFDQIATWTGSVVQNPQDGLYYMFYTGISPVGAGNVQQIGVATSPDLITWTKHPGNPISSADAAVYHSQEDGESDTNWRDPWVFFDERDQKWHMLNTGDIKGGEVKRRGTIAHSTSTDLLNWQVQQPLIGESGFGQMEVFQIEKVEDRYVLVFCVGKQHLEGFPAAFTTGTYSVPADSLTGPFHIDKTDIIDAEGIYAARIIKNRAGEWVLLGFEHGKEKEDFTGRICDPIPLYLNSQGNLKVKP